MRNRLIADSGSTKTDWALVSEDGRVAHAATQGLNPVHQGQEEILEVLNQELAVLPGVAEADEVYFYGSGCREELIPGMKALLGSVFGKASAVEVYSDLLGAARAACGRNEGIACILGTGANSCLYDGSRITANTPAMGYILGDEGSGAALGKLFLNTIFKNPALRAVRDLFIEETQMTMADVIDRVYRQPHANRFLASQSVFIHAHIDIPSVEQLVVDNFRSFVVRNLMPYGRRDLPVYAVGSIASVYERQLRTALELEGFRLADVVKNPISGLEKYHAF